MRFSEDNIKNAHIFKVLASIFKLLAMASEISLENLQQEIECD